MNPEALENVPTPISILAWASHKIRRVCRSTLAAEAQGLCIALEGADYLKVVLAECRYGKFALDKYRHALQEVEGIAMVDARSVYDYVTRDSGKLPGDKRLGIDWRLPQDYPRGSNYTLMWVAGAQQLADCLTKESADLRYFHCVARRGEFQLIKDEALESKVKSTIERWQYQSLDDVDLPGTTEVSPQKRHKADSWSVEKESSVTADPEERRMERTKRKGESQRRRDNIIRPMTVEGLAQGQTASALLTQHGAVRAIIQGFAAPCQATG